MQKIYKVLGKRERITIPWEIRRSLGFALGDVISFEQDGGAVLVKREKLCDGCKGVPVPEQPGKTDALLTELLDSLSAEEVRTALIHLSVRWAGMTQKAGDSG